MTSINDYLKAFWPVPIKVDAKERWRAFLGATIGILLTALISRWLSGAISLTPWLVAPLGASAVLVFAVPASPLAQPWSVIGGNTIAALIGTLCVINIHDLAVASALAVGLAIAVMFFMRCLHPPGGAAALLAVLTHATDYRFAVFPMLFNSVSLVLIGIAYNSLTGRRYPHTQATPSQPTTNTRFSSADLDAALTHYNQVLDVSRDDLENLLHHAEMALYRRNLGELRCADIMTRQPVSVEYSTPLTECWVLMRNRRIKALPVIDKSQRIVGIVTVADFMRQADLDIHEGLGVRLKAFLKPSGTTHTDKPEAVGHIMSRQVRVASEQSHVIELVPLFSEGGHHHIPIINEERRLVGIITQSDLVRALYRAVQPGQSERTV